MPALLKVNLEEKKDSISRVSTPQYISLDFI